MSQLPPDPISSPSRRTPETTDDPGSVDLDEVLRPRTSQWRRAAQIGSLLALLLVVVWALLRGASGSASVTPKPTPTSVWVFSSGAAPTPTALRGIAGVPLLGAAPASCGGRPPVLSQAGPPQLAAIGVPPVRLSGFLGPYATLGLGPDAHSVHQWKWTAPYGWPAPITLVIRSDVVGPVTLTGWNPRDDHPLWFGFGDVSAGAAPLPVMTRFTLDPMHPSLPPAGLDDTGNFWYGDVFLPEAGCYILAATWPGGSWQIMVSAGQ